MSCATCHDPAHAFARPPGQSPIPPGGANLDVTGFRKVPSLCYLAKVPAFSLQMKKGRLIPTGGLTHDGRVDTLAQQARLPLLAPHEMANASVAGVADKLSRTSYAKEFRAAFGDEIFENPERAFGRPC